MVVELLVHAQDTRKGEKGKVVAIRDGKDLLSSPWGRKETLPNFVVIRLTDANAQDVRHYTAPELSTEPEEDDLVPIKTGRSRRLIAESDVDSALNTGRSTTTKTTIDSKIVDRPTGR